MNTPKQPLVKKLTLSSSQPLSYQLQKHIAGPIQRYLGFYRANLWWYEPISKHASLPCTQPLQWVLLQTTNGYAALLPDNQVKQELVFSYDGLQFTLYNQLEDDDISSLGEQTPAPGAQIPMPNDQDWFVWLSVHSNPYLCIAEAFKALRSSIPSMPLAPWWRKLGWCTWDAFYTSVSIDGIIAGLEQLTALGHCPGWMIIDDGWQQTSDNKLVATTPDPVKFTNTLHQDVARIKQQFSLDLGVWHALFGYWGGWSPDAPWPAYEFIDNEVQLWPKNNKLTYTHIVAPSDIAKWYDNYHQQLNEAGVDFVKIDGQAFVDHLVSELQQRSDTTQAYQQAINSSVNQNFSQQNIHCMAHHPHIIANASCAIWRNSDDYFPRDDADHGKHIMNNAFNALWGCSIGLPDWDMFQSCHPHSEYHALARVISGGPIYLSDSPGQHDHSLIDKLVIHHNQLLQPDDIALPTPASLFRAHHDRHELVVVNNVANDVQLLGLFNCQNYGFKLATDVGHDDLRQPCSQPMTVYSYRQCHAALLAPEHQWHVTLPSQNAELLAFIPVAYDMSVIGVVDKILTAKTFESLESTPDHTEIRVHCSGRFWLACYERPPQQILLDGEALPITTPESHIYQITLPHAGRLQIKR